MKLKNNKRVFWLGMHKILVQTELPRLRQLGYEVFIPPYLSSTQDQSACVEWDKNQITTLPKEIFNKLASYNFFYNTISEEMSEILNAYFSTVIITIEPLWLLEILKVYHGVIIYRTYGYYTLICKVLESLRAMHLITSRDNFWFVPHAVESVNTEDSWLRERERVVPYCLTGDIFEHENSWNNEKSDNAEIAMSCPNINNPFYLAHYQYLREHFPDNYYRYYGVQLTDVSRKFNLVGTLTRQELIARFQRSSGYLYTYKNPNVCFLPPIEMMILGGPVLYFSGCLLNKYFKHNTPGCCVDVAEAHYKSHLLLKNDQAFINEVICSQNDVRKLYTPEHVWPIFDATFKDLIDKNNRTTNWLAIDVCHHPKAKKRIYIFTHGSVDVFYNKNVYEIVEKVLKILTIDPDIEVYLTGKADQVANLNSYFVNYIATLRARILCVNPSDLMRSSIESVRQKKGVLSYVKIMMRACFSANLRGYVKTMIKSVCVHYQHFVEYNDKRANLNLKNMMSWHVNLINNDDNCSYVIIPHGYLFPEALQLKKAIVLYLPDQGTKKVDKKILHLLRIKAEAVVCDSSELLNFIKKVFKC